MPPLPGGGYGGFQSNLAMSFLSFPRSGVKAVKLSRHTGMNPGCMDASRPRHPWNLDSGIPCRNDEQFLFGIFASTAFSLRVVPVVCFLIDRSNDSVREAE